MTPFAHLFQVNVGPQTVQIAFSNQRDPNGPPDSAASVAMSRADAEQLRDLLTKLLADA